LASARSSMDASAGACSLRPQPSKLVSFRRHTRIRISMRRSIAPPRRFAKWYSLALASLLLSGCFPGVQPPGPAPVDGPPREPTVRVGILVDSARAVLGATTNLEI